MSLLTLGLVCLVGVPAEGWAQEGSGPAEGGAEGSAGAEAEAEAERKEGSFTSGPSVRRKVLYRSTRLEVAPMIGTTTSSSYMRDVVGGVNINYYLTNAIGVGLIGGYAPLHLETDLANNVKNSLNENDPERLEDLRLAYLQWFAGIEFKFVPIFGKFSLMNKSTAHYDLHLMGGMTFMGRGVCDASNVNDSCGSNPVSGETNFESGLTPAGSLGAGLRLFLGDAYAVNLQARTHLYRRAEAGTGNPNPEFSSNTFVNLGFSFFFPQSVKISR